MSATATPERIMAIAPSHRTARFWAAHVADPPVDPTRLIVVTHPSHVDRLQGYRGEVVVIHGEYSDAQHLVMEYVRHLPVTLRHVST